MPQPVFFPSHDPISSQGPHIIGDHSKTRSKSRGRLGIPQGGRGLIQRMATSDWEDRHPSPLGVNTGRQWRQYVQTTPLESLQGTERGGFCRIQASRLDQRKIVLGDGEVKHRRERYNS